MWEVLKDYNLVFKFYRTGDLDCQLVQAYSKSLCDFL